MARAKSYTCGIHVGGLPPTTLRRSKMALLDTHALAPLSIPVVGSDRRNATHTASGLALLDWPRSVDRGALTASRRLVPGRHGGMRWPTSIGAAQDPAPDQGATTPGVPSSPQHFRDERLAGERVLPRKTRKARARVFCQHSLCAALVWCTDRAAGVRNSKPRKPVRPVRNTGAQRSSHAVFGGRLKSSPPADIRLVRGKPG